MNTRKLLTTGAAAVVAVLAFATDAQAFGKRKGNGCCGGGGYTSAYSGGCYGSGYGSGYGYGGCYGSGYGGSYAPYSGGCYGSGYAYGGSYSGGYAVGGGYSGAAASYPAPATIPAAGPGVVVQSPAGVVPAAAVAPQVVVPAGGVLPAGYGGFSSGYGPAVTPAGVSPLYSVPYGVTPADAILNYGTTRTGRGLFRR